MESREAARRSRGDERSDRASADRGGPPSQGPRHSSMCPRPLVPATVAPASPRGDTRRVPSSSSARTRGDGRSTSVMPESPRRASSPRGAASSAGRIRALAASPFPDTSTREPGGTCVPRRAGERPPSEAGDTRQRSCSRTRWASGVIGTPAREAAPRVRVWCSISSTAVMAAPKDSRRSVSSMSRMWRSSGIACPDDEEQLQVQLQLQLHVQPHPGPPELSSLPRTSGWPAKARPFRATPPGSASCSILTVRLLIL